MFLPGQAARTGDQAQESRAAMCMPFCCGRLTKTARYSSHQTTDREMAPKESLKLEITPGGYNMRPEL